MENKQFKNSESMEASEQKELTSGWVNPTSKNQIIKILDEK